MHTIRPAHTSRYKATVAAALLLAAACSSTNPAPEAATAVTDNTEPVAATTIDDDFQEHADDRQAEISEQIESIVAEGADCVPVEPTVYSAPTQSQIVVEIVRQRDGCLDVEVIVVDMTDEGIDQLTQIHDDPNVIAMSPVSEAIPLRQDTGDLSDEARARDWVGFPTNAASNWPKGEGAIVGIIDDSITVPELKEHVIPSLPGQTAFDPTHGDIVASTIVGRSEPGSTVAVAPQASLVDAAVFSGVQDVPNSEDPDYTRLFFGQISRRIIWAVDSGADVINGSVGLKELRPEESKWWHLLPWEDDLDIGTSTYAMFAATEYARQNGAIVIISAGNCGAPSDKCDSVNQAKAPASLSNTFAVGAVEYSQSGGPVVADYSTRASYVDIAAPGTVHFAADGPEPSAKRGTSYAAPFVSGVVALLVGDDGPLNHLEGIKRVETIEKILRDTATDVGPAGRDDETGYGVINVRAALEAAGWVEGAPKPQSSVTDQAAACDMASIALDGMELGTVNPVVFWGTEVRTATAYTAIIVMGEAGPNEVRYSYLGLDPAKDATPLADDEGALLLEVSNADRATWIDEGGCNEPDENSLQTKSNQVSSCDGTMLAYGVTQDFKVAVCQSGEGATFRRLNRRTGDVVSGSACSGEAVVISLINGWEYQIDLEFLTPELVIIDETGDLYLRERLLDSSLAHADHWGDHVRC